MLILFLLFTIVPIIELFLLIEVGKVIGAWDTVFIVFTTGVVGAYMAKSQGLSILMSTQKQLAQGQLPTDNIIQGVLVFIGGVFLITPGFITDFLGLTLVFPLTRNLYIHSVKTFFQKKIKSGGMQFYTNINGEWYSSENQRDVTPGPKKVNDQPAKIIDIKNYRSHRDH
ncbi:MAG: FxsA family protein [Bdellovibrionaceae bacterium]|nr:FxsA family protein [Pseudobdellovibrionaceae bacterium]